MSGFASESILKNGPGIEVKNTFNKNTGISSLDYHCVATGWSSEWDINENGVHTNTIWTYVNDATQTWFVRAQFASNEPSCGRENPDVDVLCFKKEIAEWQGVNTAGVESEDTLRTLNDPSNYCKDIFEANGCI